VRTQAVVFSKDRALQLRATLESLLLRCTDAAEELRVRVLYKACGEMHRRQYNSLKESFPQVEFVAETDFRIQLLRLLADTPYVLFLVDDNIFYRDFSLGGVLECLEAAPGAVGFSLRLGRNTTYCHTQDAPQRVPGCTVLRDNVLCCRWRGADHDFGYPLEVSSSVYRTAHMLALLHDMPFTNPNLLEAGLSRRTGAVEDSFPQLLFFDRSVTFCNPLNRVQDTFANRVADEPVDAQALAQLYARGQMLDVAAYGDALPDAAHYEMPLRLRSVPAEPEHLSVTDRPFISAVIPVFNGASFLPDAVRSLHRQRYEPMEVIIVNDGSTDDSSAVGAALAAQYPALRIRVADKDNGGLASARNAGIGQAGGGWILPLDCDDCFAPEFVGRAAEIISQRPGVNLVFANMQEFGARQGRWNPEPYSLQELMRRNTFPYASLYRKELWEQSGGYDPSMPWGAEDWLFWLSCAPFGLCPHRIEEPLFLYRTHPHGSMYTRMMERWDVVRACLRTLLPALYPAAALLQDHTLVAGMDADTAGVIADIRTRHPRAAMPAFWQGLVHEAAGRTAEAVAGYMHAAAHAPYAQWQPHLRLFMCNLRLGRKKAAHGAAVQAVLRRPELAPLFSGYRELDLQALLPRNMCPETPPR
jgi:hypothetical protein